MNRVAGVIKMHSKDMWSWFIIPWMVMLSSFFINLIISLFVDKPIYTGGISSIYIYMFVAGIVTLAQTFHFALGLGVSRKDYYIGTSAMVVLTSIFSAFVLFLLSRTEVWTEAWGTGLHFFHVPYLSDGPLINQFIVPLLILLFMHYSGILISAAYRRMGKNGLFIASGILLAVSSVLGVLATYLNWYPAIFAWIIRQSAVDYTLWMLPFTAVFALASYLLLRRATV